MCNLQQYFSDDYGGLFQGAVHGILNDEIATIPPAEHDGRFGVGGNTFRALVNCQRPPSDVYREWATLAFAILNADPQAVADTINTQEGFAAWHAELAASLQNYWQHEQDGHALEFAHQNKLVDLFIKWLSALDLGNEQLTNAFVAYANCALDRTTLAFLNQCLSSALPLSNLPRMGHVRTAQTYAFCQCLIRCVAENYGGTPLLFDYFAWAQPD